MDYHGQDQENVQVLALVQNPHTKPAQSHGCQLENLLGRLTMGLIGGPAYTVINSL